MDWIGLDIKQAGILTCESLYENLHSCSVHRLQLLLVCSRAGQLCVSVCLCVYIGWNVHV